MNLLYLCTDTTKSVGVIQKIVGKVCKIKEAGINVQGLFVNTNHQVTKNLIIDENQEIHFHSIEPYKPSKIFWRRFVRYFLGFVTVMGNDLKKYRDLNREVKKKEKDLILFRYPGGSLGLLLFCISNRKKIIFEHNTFELEELKTKDMRPAGMKTIYYSEFLFGPLALSFAKGIIGVTNEIVEYELKRAWKKPKSFLFSNGAEVLKYPKKKCHINSNENSIKLLMLCGSPVNWHGIDRVIEGMELSENKEKFHLYVAGNVLEERKQLVKKLDLDAHVTFFDSLSGTDLDNLFDNSDIAIGTLGLHRKGLKEACPLKVREYLSRGIPVILAYNDTDITENLNFILQLPVGEKPVDMVLVEEFYQKLKPLEKQVDIIRNYAIENIDLEIKINQLVGFLEKLNGSIINN